MIIKDKVFPHPVLSPYSDDIASSIDCNVDVDFDKSYYYFKCIFTLNNHSIIDLLKSKSIYFIVHIECGKTFYRKIHKVNIGDFLENKLSQTISIPATQLKDNTEVSVFICADSEVRNYRPDNMHSDYGSASFNLKNGDFVAIWKTYSFDLYQDYDPIMNVYSIITFKLDEGRETGEITVDTEQDKLTASLPKDLYQMYHSLFADKSKQDILLSAIGVPIIMEGLAYIKESKIPGEDSLAPERRRLRWFRSLEKKLSDLKIEIDSCDCLFVVAQSIFKNPYKRTGMAFEKIDETLG